MTFESLRRGAWILFACTLACPLHAQETPSGATDRSATLQLSVDLTDLDRRIFRVREEIPVVAGPLSLFYPKWLPGTHAPTGPIEQLAGLKLTANGQSVAWKRDALDMFTFHLVVPEGATRLVLDFQFTSPLDPAQGRIVVTPQILGLQWNTVVLYPAGHAADRIMIEPRITLPDGWKLQRSRHCTVEARRSLQDGFAEPSSTRHCSPVAISASSISMRRARTRFA